MPEALSSFSSTGARAISRRSASESGSTAASAAASLPRRPPLASSPSRPGRGEAPRSHGCQTSASFSVIDTSHIRPSAPRRFVPTPKCAALSAGWPRCSSLRLRFERPPCSSSTTRGTPSSMCTCGGARNTHAPPAAPSADQACGGRSWPAVTQCCTSKWTDLIVYRRGAPPAASSRRTSSISHQPPSKRKSTASPSRREASHPSSTGGGRGRTCLTGSGVTIRVLEVCCTRPGASK
mmetsp:Transcript_23188/g.68434  ORF Transcript_23188/g.68434 Transcript_23188/m.68434 type:complete len:237 (-) Transcript_23188:416-1126(-)